MRGKSELETEGKRRVRGGVQEEGDETARISSFSVQTTEKRRPCKSGWTSCARTLWQKSIRQTPEKGITWRSNSRLREAWCKLGQRRVFFHPLVGATNRAAMSVLTSSFADVAGSSVDHHPSLLVSSVVTTPSLWRYLSQLAVIQCMPKCAPPVCH